MQQIDNAHDIPLLLAAWAVHDEYDYIDHPAYISATSLMKPLRHIILPSRQNDLVKKNPDVEEYISRALGHSIHDSVEKAWTKGYRTNLKKLGYPDAVIDRVLINPTDEELDAADNPIPVYLEQRMYRRFGSRIIGGKYDAITDGIVSDTKSTSAFSWVFGGRNEDYQLQGSLYRWLDAKGHSDIDMTKESAFRPRITEDFIRINFVFTDWSKQQARQNKGYPQRRLEQKDIPLMSVEETEAWIRRKLRLVDKYKDAPESEIPECTPDELWMPEPTHKYYKDPAKAADPKARSTKNFDDLGEAHRFMAEKGGVGVIKTIQGEPKRCAYCPAFDNCTQKDKYL